MKEMSESTIIIALLTISGGLMDAYSYFARNHVFANAQTGNIVLSTYYLLNLDFDMFYNYLSPIICFVFGVTIAEVIHYYLKENHIIHWRQIGLAIELIIILIVGFIPNSLNVLANSLLSLICGMQLSSFKKAHDNSLATTMCIGNLRQGVECLVDGIASKNSTIIKKGLFYFSLILYFIIGALIGGFLNSYLHNYTIFINLIFVSLAFILLFIKPSLEQKNSD